MMVASFPANRRSLAEPASVKRSLASILRDHGPLPVTDAVDVALDVCEELANAHANGIVHGDLGLHRVRMHWPRAAGERVDIFVLDESDTAAFAFRTSAVGTLVSPEQREGRPVDVRADVWAVGAMLHWLISGGAPYTAPLEKALAGAPRTLALAIASCLETDPARRPHAIGELAEILSSFASSPAERFEQLARRRALMEDATRARTGRPEVVDVLGRLDDAAIAREVAAASVTPADRLMLTVQRTVGGAPFEPPTAVEAPPSSRSLPPTESAQRPAIENVHSVLPLVTTPPVLSSALLSAPLSAPRMDTPSAFDVAVASEALPPRRMKPWMVPVAAIGAVASVALGVMIGVQTVERLTEAPAARSAAESAPPAAPVPVVTSAPARTAAAVAPAPVVPPEPRTMTPAALPDAKPLRRRGPTHRSKTSPSASTAPAALDTSAPASTQASEPAPAPAAETSTPTEREE